MVLIRFSSSKYIKNDGIYLTEKREDVRDTERKQRWEDTAIGVEIIKGYSRAEIVQNFGVIKPVKDIQKYQ